MNRYLYPFFSIFRTFEKEGLDFYDNFHMQTYYLAELEMIHYNYNYYYYCHNNNNYYYCFYYVFLFLISMFEFFNISLHADDMA